MPDEMELLRFIQESETGIGESGSKCDVPRLTLQYRSVYFRSCLTVICTARCWALRCDELLLVTR